MSVLSSSKKTWTSLGDVCSTISKGTTPTSYGHEYVQKGVPFLRAEDVNGGAVDGTTASFHIEPETNKFLKRSQLQPGDILITIAGTIGRVGYVPLNAPPLNCNQAVAFARPDTSVLDPEYACFMLRTPDIIASLINLKVGGGVQNLNLEQIRALQIPLVDIEKQKWIVKYLAEQISTVNRARTAAETQIEAAKALPGAYLRSSLAEGKLKTYHLSDCLLEVKNGIGADWTKYPVLGATRAGLAPAKDPVGKVPERYKLVDHGTVFYNPMRILLGSIAMVDHCDEPGITSPDYVVVKGKREILDTRWFYYFFRSTMGEHLIKTLVRGAVRERILFKRLAKGEIELPAWETQVKFSNQMYKARDLIKPIEDRIKKIDALPAKYLKMAFNGDL